MKGNLIFRERAKRADYLLHFSDNNLDENVERIVHCVLELGDKNERILTY